MTDHRYLLAIDQGTTSSRAIVFDQQGQPLASSQQEFPQHFPDDGWVEHDPEAIWQSVRHVCEQVLRERAASPSQIAAIGITNQRETTVIWERDTGQPIYPAIVWQDRRTAKQCQALRDAGHESLVSAKTGLLIDPYFSASKIAWILDHVEGARARAERGELAFGTIDSFLIWKLTGGKTHATDATNASRTSLYNVFEHAWDDALLRLFNVPAALLPEVKDCADDFGEATLLGGTIPIRGVAGDQQAALVGQACFQPGMIKSTYGTGCFVILNTGSQWVTSNNRLLSTVAYRLNGTSTFALEGSIFAAGATIQWLRDGLQLINHAAETEQFASRARREHSVYLVPAFTGLGAPHWDPDARGAISGLTRDTGIAEIIQAGLQSVCYQTKDLITAMAADGAVIQGLRVDGGMVANNWFVQFLADLLNVPVERPKVTETTALGAAYLAGLGVGLYAGLDTVADYWQTDTRFEPTMADTQRDRLYGGWQEAIRRVKTSAS